MRSSTAASGSGLPNPVNVVNDTNPIPAEGSPPVTIASVARECSQAFKEYSKRPYPGTEQDMERRHSRFLKLVSDLAIDRDSTYPSGLGYILSLDAILDKDDSTKGKLIRLLSFMVQHIRRGTIWGAWLHSGVVPTNIPHQKQLKHQPSGIYLKAQIHEKKRRAYRIVTGLPPHQLSPSILLYRR